MIQSCPPRGFHIGDVPGANGARSRRSGIYRGRRSTAQVWDALTNPDVIKRYMFGVDAECDWREGSPLILRGMWEGTPLEDRGTVLRVEEGRLLEYAHFSPLSGAEDLPENYHTITLELAEEGGPAVLSLAQHNNATEEERDHSASVWATMLGTLKDVLEG